MILISNIKLPIKHELSHVRKKACGILGVPDEKIKSFSIAKKSLDARDKDKLCYVYSVNIEIDNPEKYLKIKNVTLAEEYSYSYKKVSNKDNIKRPVIVGSGPAGLFAALTLANAGLNPLVIERGKAVDQRNKDVMEFFSTGKLNAESNVQFGEGGAGTFSDGKLTTGIRDSRIRLVFNEFVKAGAPEEILYVNKPHIGTDLLTDVVKNIRNEIISLGGEVRFSAKLVDIHYKDGKIERLCTKDADGNITYVETDNIILAIGHSARDTFEMLAQKKEIVMEQKDFAVGVRIEHTRKMIDTSQYGVSSSDLPAAEYKLAERLPDGRGVYTFCMCPGGVVVAASSEEGYLAVNGMSWFKRDMENSNSALLVTVYKKDFHSDDILAGMALQRNIERTSFICGGGDYKAPIQLVGDFLNDKQSTQIYDVVPSYRPNTTFAMMSDILPPFVVQGLKIGIKAMDKKLKGFAKYDSVLTGVETRSSSPIRIIRNENYESSLEGLFPCGEGCGYAGGIVSAAVDGIKCAEAIIEKIQLH